MRGIPKGVVVIATVIVLSGAVFYVYAEQLWYGFFPTVEAPTAPTVAPPQKKGEVSAEVRYSIADTDKNYHVRFTLLVDTEGTITGVKMVELPKEETSEKQQAFADNLTVMIKGKKLSELTKVDKVGKSTLTTDAFNSVIDELKTGRY